MQFILTLICCAATWYPLTAGEAGASGFLQVSKRQVTLQEIQDSVRLALSNNLVAHNSTSDAHTSVEKIEKSVQPTYRALPKNQQGGIGSTALVYLVRSYFAKEHGWHIHGLGTYASNVSASDLHNTSILEQMAPAIVQNLIDAHSVNHVFFLKDVVAMVATLEYLVISESTRILEDIYDQEKVDPESMINEELLMRLLVVYSVTFELPGNPTENQQIASRVLNQNFNHEMFLDPVKDIVGNFEFVRGHQNPFSKSFHFEDAVTMVTEYHKSYGKRQMEECTLMKEELMRRDHSGMGRIPLHEFHAEIDANSTVFEFGEGKDYLREIGALDESNALMPKVIIPNYVLGPWNCLARSGYYAICCLNECESIMNAVEQRFETPTVAPQPLLELVGNLSSATIDGPRQLPDGLAKKLHEIAHLHKGDVPIYGRLFAQWLHFAFPYECPYPSLQAGNIKKEMWMPDRETVTSDSEEKEAVQQEALLANQTSEDDNDDVYDILWDDLEVLHIAHQKQRSSAWSSLSTVMLALMLLSACGSLVTVVQQMRQVIHPTKCELKCNV